MTEDEFVSAINTLINHYGKENQTNIAVEELSELIQALCKFRREKTAKTRNNLIEELADSEIVFNEILVMYLTEEEILKIDKVAECKLKRQLDRMEKGE